jgi:hypothetical protein
VLGGNLGPVGCDLLSPKKDEEFLRGR